MVGLTYNLYNTQGNFDDKQIIYQGHTDWLTEPKEKELPVGVRKLLSRQATHIEGNTF